MYYYLYKITNIINNKFYIGVHRTSNINDEYFGSGINITRAIKKYGKENFKKEILKFFENAPEMFFAEKEMVTEDFLKNPLVYNIRVGGKGGFTTEMSVKGAMRTVTSKIGIHAQTFEQYSAAGKQGSATGLKLKRGFHDPKHKDRILQAGIKGSNIAREVNKGTVFVYHNAIGLKKCRKDLIPEYIEQGWIYLSPKSKCWKIIKSQE